MFSKSGLKLIRQNALPQVYLEELDEPRPDFQKSELSPQLAHHETLSETCNESDSEEEQVAFTLPQKCIIRDPLSLDESSEETELYCFEDIRSSETDTASESEEHVKLRPEDRSNNAGEDQEQQEVTNALAPNIRKRKRRYIGDITIDDFATPDTAKKNFMRMKETYIHQSKTIKVLKNSVRRLRTKISNLNDSLKLLGEKSLIGETAEPATSLTGLPGEIFQRMLKGQKSPKISEELKSFALTLNSYSPNAYNYMWKTFKSLPHPSTITKWGSHTDNLQNVHETQLSENS